MPAEGGSYRLEGGEDENPVLQAARIVALEYRRLQDAYESGDESRICACRKAHLDAGEKLRHLEHSHRQGGAVEEVLVNRYRAQLTERLRPVRKAFTDLLEMLGQMKGVHFTTEDREEVQEWLNRRFQRLIDDAYAAS